jgi:hypothetical protein
MKGYKEYTESDTDGYYWITKMEKRRINGTDIDG